MSMERDELRDRYWRLYNEMRNKAKSPVEFNIEMRKARLELLQEVCHINEKETDWKRKYYTP